MSYRNAPDGRQDSSGEPTATHGSVTYLTGEIQEIDKEAEAWFIRGAGGRTISLNFSLLLDGK